MAKTTAIRAGKAYVEISAHTASLMKGLQRASARLKAFGAGVRNLGMKFIGLGAVMLAPFVLAGKIFGGFEDEMLTVRAVTNATAEQFAKMTEQAKLLGRTTSFTAKQVAEGMTSLGRAGFKPDQIEAAIPAVLNLARATRTELGEAADYAANAVRAFGLSASDTIMVADVLTATANNSAQVLSDLAEAMKYVAPIAADAGESIQSTSKALGVLANMGIKGSMAGTAIRKMLLQLAKPEIQRTLTGMGVAAVDAVGNLRPLGDVMADLGKAMAGLPTAKRLALADVLFGQRAISGALKLVGSVDQIKQLAEAIDNAGGAADRTARIMDSGLGGAFRMMMSAAEGVFIGLGKAIASTLGKWMKVIRRGAEMLAVFIGQHETAVTVILAVAASALAAGIGLVVLGTIIGGLGHILAGLAMVVSLVGLVFKALAVTIGFLLTPVGLVMAAVGAMAGYLIYATGAGGKALSWLGERFCSLADDARTAFGAIGAALAAGDIGLAAKVFWLTLKLEWQKGQKDLLDLFGGLGFAVRSAHEKMVSGMTEVWLVGLYSLRRIWTEFASWHARAVESFANAFAKCWIDIQGIFDKSLDTAYMRRQIDEMSQMKVQAIEQERQRAVKAQQEEAKNALGMVEDEHKKQMQRLENEYTDKIGKTQEAVDAARKEWEEAIRQAGAKQIVSKDAAEGPGKLEPPPGLDKLMAQLGALTTGRISVVGTFGAERLAGLAAGNAADRTAKAAEETAKNTKRLLDEARRGGLTFA